MKDCLSVKEYATLHGMTEQAVYKKIRTGKLQTTERQENGKRKLYVLLDPAGSNETVSTPDTAEPSDTTPDPNQGDGTVDGDHAPAGVEAPAADTEDHQDAGSAAAAEIVALEKALEALTAQLAEKDRQIERLTDLLYREQELQAQSHMLLTAGTADTTPDPNQGNGTDDADHTPAGQEPEQKQQKPKKRGFWYWLFN